MLFFEILTLFEGKHRQAKQTVEQERILLKLQNTFYEFNYLVERNKI